MLRGIAAVIAGYAAMFLFVFVSFTAAYLAMGADRAFEPGTYDVSTFWVVISFVLGFVGALGGGWICALIARSSTPPKVLAGLVFVLGLLMAIPCFMTSDDAGPGPRTGDVANLDAMMQAKTPAWIALANPVVGVAGVLLGSRRRQSGFITQNA